MASKKALILFGFVAGLSTIPVLGFQFFFSFGLSLFLTQIEKSSHPIIGIGVFAFGYFLMALHWIPCSLHVNWVQYSYLIPFALLGLPLFFSLYYMAGTWFIPWHRYGPPFRIFSLALLWGLLDIVRAEFLTGFPWASLGTMWATCLPIAQLTSLMGPYGLSGLTVFWLATPYVLLSSLYTKRYKGLYATVVIVSFLGAFWYGSDRINHAPRAPNHLAYLRLVQPNFPQGVMGSEKAMRDGLDDFVTLSTRSSDHPLQAVLWPEFDFHFSPQRHGWMVDYIKHAVPLGGVLITNGFRYGNRRVYNSMMAFDHEGHGIAFYDKHRLLPFGEYIPFRQFIDSILPGQIHKMSGGMGDFTPGSGPKLLCLKGLPCFMPLICHEAIFSGKFQTKNTEKAAWILNLTNDGWFLHSLEPYQHLAMAQMRAIESGVPVVRVANTGISAVIDPLGKILLQLPYGEVQTADFYLPAPLQEKPFYAVISQWDPYSIICWILYILMALKLVFRRCYAAS